MGHLGRTGPKTNQTKFPVRAFSIIKSDEQSKRTKQPDQRFQAQVALVQKNYKGFSIISGLWKQAILGNLLDFWADLTIYLGR